MSIRCLAAVAALLALVVGSSGAFAHASLLGSEPADGAVLASPPSYLTLVFNEPVSPLVLRLIDSAGRATTLTHYRLDGATVVIDAPADIARGSHALSWRVISADGHPVGGSVLFAVGEQSAVSVPGSTENVDWLRGAAVWLCRVTLYLGFFVGVGGLFFNSFVASVPRVATRIQSWILIAALLAAPISLGLQGLDALDRPFFDLVRPIVWRTAMGTSYGATAAFALLSLAAGFVGLRTRSRRLAKLLAAIAILGVGLALAVSGHAGTAYPQLVTRPAVLLHAMAVAFWIGALLPLGLALYRRDPAAPIALARFSRIIPFVVLPLVAAGTVLAIIQIGKPAALWATVYGRLLLLKLSLLCFLFGLGAVNRWRLTAPTEAAEPSAGRRLATTIAIEAAIALCVLSVVAAWRFTPPPRSLEAATAAPVSVHIHTAKAMADVVITPGRPGPVTASIVIMTGDFELLAAKEVTLVLSNAALGIEPIRRVAALQGDGGWRVDRLFIPTAGRWDIQVAILISDFELVRLDEMIEIPSRDGRTASGATRS